MKMKHLIVAAAVALVPATASLADKASADKAKAAKEEAKKKAIEAAKEKARAEMEEKAKKNAAAAAAASAKKANAAAAGDEAKKAEEEMHTKHLGIIERLEQIATATDNAELKAKVSTLRTKEESRHALAGG
jgi:hypothetical protein